MNARDIERWDEAISKGELPEGWRPAGPAMVGRPRLCGEPLESVTVKLPASMVREVDERAREAGTNRSEELRGLVGAALRP